MKSKIIISLVLLCYSFLNALLIEVKQDGSGDYTTIQAGIDASANADTVMVYPGIYFENIDMSYKNITLASLEITTNDSQYIYSTIIDGQRLESCILIHDTENVAIRGFTIQNGYGTYLAGNYGGGFQIQCVENCLIMNCKITNNVALKGGAIFSCITNLTLSGLLVSNNSASLGGGISFDFGTNAIFDPENLCNIYNNNAGKGADLFSNYSVSTHVIVDTFTVFNPDRYFAEYDMNASYIFDIQNDWLELVASDLYVATDGDDNNSGLTPDDPLKNISWAVRKIEADSMNPRTVHVEAGAYSYADNQQIYPIGSKAYVSIIGADMQSTILNNDYAPCTFMGLNLQGDVKFSNFTLNNCLDHTMSHIMYLREIDFLELSNITIDGNDNFRWNIISEFVENVIDNVILTNNVGMAESGFSLYENKGILRNCVIENNSVVDYPMFNGVSALCLGIYDYFEVENTIISGNISTNVSSAAISMGTEPGSNGYLVLKNCLISDNYSANEYLMCIGSNEGTYLNNVTIANNTSSNTTITAYRDLTLRNSVMHNNTDHEVFMADVSYETINELDVDNCNIKNGFDGIYNENDVNIITWGENNINAHSQFDSLSIHPYSLLDNSPCIDTGTPDTTGLFLPPWDLLYNVRIFDGDGNGIATIDMGCYEFGADSVGVIQNQIINKGYQLANYPNPFNPETKIAFNLLKAENVKLEIFNIKGQKVKTLINKNLDKGQHQIVWYGNDDLNKSVSSGVYFYKLSTKSENIIKRMILLK